MTVSFRPTSEAELASIVGEAAADGRRLGIAGGGSKNGVGAPVEAAALDLTGFAGVVDYDPAELVLTVQPGTPLRELQALVASEQQMLAFEPYDPGGIVGTGDGRATIGGTIAAGIAGSQRVSTGGARDHLLGLRAVSGRGEVFVAGAKVVKNVTGYDLPKLAAGSWGRLFALTEITLKVLPRPRESQTWAIGGLDTPAAVSAMAAAMSSQAEVAAAAYLPARLAGGQTLTLLRIQGFGPSVTARGMLLTGLLRDVGALHKLDEAVAESCWAMARGGSGLSHAFPLWRIVVPPSRAASVVAMLNDWSTDWLLDWAGGLIWWAGEGDAAAIRVTVAEAGGHATLLRAPAKTRAKISALHPQPKGLAALEARVRRAFDPAGVFETGRF